MSSGSSPHPPTGSKERAGPCHLLGGGGGGLVEERDDSSDNTEVRRRDREYFMSTS